MHFPAQFRTPVCSDELPEASRLSENALSKRLWGNAQGTEFALRKRALKGRPKAFDPGRLAWALIERRFAAQNLETPELRPQAWALIGRPTG